MGFEGLNLPESSFASSVGPSLAVDLYHFRDLLASLVPGAVYEEPVLDLDGLEVQISKG